MKADHII